MSTLRDRITHTRIFLVLLVLFLSACGKEKAQSTVPNQENRAQSIQRNLDPQQLALGKKVFATFCSRCHGKQAEGAPNWRKVGADKKYPPPPLNGTGHAWHHPRHILKEIIMNGTKPQGNMPAWKTTLNEKQIDAVIVWFQSLWPDELYAAWQEMDRDSQ